MATRHTSYPATGLPRDAAPGARPPLALRGRWLWLGRAVWALFAALAIGLAIAKVPRELTGSMAFPGLGAPQSDILAGLRQLGIDPALYVAYRVALELAPTLIGLVTAAVLVWRRSSDGVVLLLAVFLVAGIALVDPHSLVALAATRPLEATLGKVLTTTRMTLLLALFFVFPDGRLIPRWGWLPVGAWCADLIGIMFFPGTVLDSWGWPPLPTALGFALLFGPAIYAQVYRYRRVSGPVERQQTKWAVGGLVVALVGFAALNVWLAGQGNNWAGMSPARAVVAEFAFGTAFTLAFALIPVTLAIAILRHRLFDIDVIINRALVYGGLTLAVVGGYAVLVGYLGTLLRTGTDLPISLLATGVIAILFQPLRERLQRGVNRLLYGERDEPYAVISRLGRRLEETLAPDAILPTIVETVAGALKLPYAAIALRSGAERTIAAATGAPPPDPVRLPLAYRGEPVGELLLAPRAPGEPFSLADRRLLDDLARQAGVAAQAVRLADEARHLAAALQASRERLVTAREEERRRLRRDLHDGLGPALASQALTVDTALLLLERDPPAAAALLEAVREQSQAAVAEIRRVAYALRPPALDDLGLVGALRDAASKYAGTELDVTVEAPETLPPLAAAVEVAAFRIAQEAVANVARHAHARRCTVTLAVGAALEVAIADDGVGIAAGRRAGVGLTSMRERAEELGGTCAFEANPGGGTRVIARLPL
ncbi:MAG TPA: sensor histidine kinase [Thermomicrobiales bacterium]|nr:sensor histidine kinase [Thermomicrobiales bacterium]